MCLLVGAVACGNNAKKDSCAKAQTECCSKDKAECSPKTKGECCEADKKACCSKEKDKIVILHASMEIKPEFIEDFKEIAKALVDSTRKEEGCISYTLLQDVYNPTIFTFYEEYKNMDAVKFHSSQQYLKDFSKLREPMMEKRIGVKKYCAAAVE